MGDSSIDKILMVGVIGIPTVIFLTIFGDRILTTFIINENDQIDAQTGMTEALVGGSGWTDPGGWAVEE